MSNIHAPDFYEPRKKWRTKKRDEFLRKNVGIDPELPHLAGDEMAVLPARVEDGNLRPRLCQ